MDTTISYGKAAISLYRTYAAPLEGVAAIPESSFVGRTNTLFAAEIEVEVLGNNFLAAYTEGDNSAVVATDTMKNFVLQQALQYEGATLEGFLAMLGQAFLATYPQMEHLRVSGREQPFAATPVPSRTGWTVSPVLFARQHDAYAAATLELQRQGDAVSTVNLESTCRGLQLIKLTGSSFTHFVRDAYTTLPETIDRPLFIFVDVGWRYADPAQAVGDDHSHYVVPEQVRDCCEVVFHEFVSKSIQHLVHEMGQRLLARFPQLSEVSFDAQNRLWDTAFVSDADPKIKVYTDPRPPYGLIRLTLRREDAATGGAQL